MRSKNHYFILRAVEIILKGKALGKGGDVATARVSYEPEAPESRQGRKSGLAEKAMIHAVGLKERTTAPGEKKQNLGPRTNPCDGAAPMTHYGGEKKLGRWRAEYLRTGRCPRTD